MDSQGQVRVGIVGCGYQGLLMAQAIARTEMLDDLSSPDSGTDHDDAGSRAGGVCDRHPERPPACHHRDRWQAGAQGLGRSGQVGPNEQTG